MAIRRISSLSPADRSLILGHLDQIFKHVSFRSTRRCQDLLRFIIQQALDERFELLKERTIGVEVFGREAAYDTASDSVVRVTANEVRKRLAQYYLDVGESSRLRLELPSGSYIPEFAVEAETEILPVHHEAMLLTPGPPPMPVSDSRKNRRTVGASLLHYAVTGVLLACCLWLIYENRQMSSFADSRMLQTLPWSALLDGRRQTYVVLGDLAVGTSEDLMHRQLLLQDYINREYLKDSSSPTAEVYGLAQLIIKRQFTSAADALIAAKIAQLGRPDRHPTVRFARDMHIDNFRDDNIVLIGSTRANLWGELVDQYLNFHIEYEEKLGQHLCRNRRPKPGERETYMPAGPTGTTGDAYAVVAFLPNLQSNGHVLLLAGTNMEATEAAGEFIMDSGLRNNLKGIGLSPEGPPRRFEILLKVNAVAGSPHQCDVIASRL